LGGFAGDGVASIIVTSLRERSLLARLRLFARAAEMIMARRSVLPWFAGVVGAPLVSGCGVLGERASYRFRMAVQVDTARGMVSGDSVYEVTASKNLRLTSEETTGGGGLRGQAVIVDVPDGPIFALLKLPPRGDRLALVVTRALSGKEQLGDTDDYIAAVRNLGGWFGGAKGELPREYWPMMVRFRNINDPTSVELLDPESAGVKRIIVETTNESVTSGIERRLPWLPRQRGSLIKRLSVPNPADPPIGARLNEMDFSTEVHRGR
jgi:hypothetical protein